MKKCSYKESFYILIAYAFSAIALSLITMPIVGIASFIPVVISFITLDYSDNLSDSKKITYWWPFYLGL